MYGSINLLVFEITASQTALESFFILLKIGNLVFLARSYGEDERLFMKHVIRIGFNFYYQVIISVIFDKLF